MHDVITIGLPLFAILAGILLNRQDAAAIRSELRTEISGLRNELRTEMNRRFDSVDNRLESVQRDMREFYAEQARHDQRITTLEQK